MNNYKVDLKITTPILSSNRAEDGKFYFEKLNGHTVIKKACFNAAKVMLFKTLGFAYPERELQGIKIIPEIESSTAPEVIDTYFRRITSRHEALTGCITIKFLTPDSVGEELFTEFLSDIGAYIGLSPWGSRLGYGKFIVSSVEVTENAQISDGISHAESDCSTGGQHDQD